MSPWAGWSAKYGKWVEPALVVLGIHAVHFLNTRVAVATAPNLSVARPIKGLAAWLFTSWDAEHYLRLATNYDSYAWPPLYPMTLRLIAAIGVDVQVAAVLLNLLAHTVIVYLAYAYVRGNPRLTEVPGWLFASLLLYFPGHNVFFAAYSESLFLALALGACVAYQAERLWLAGLLCGLSLLTRNMGMFLGVAFIAVEVLRSLRDRTIHFRDGRIAPEEAACASGARAGALRGALASLRSDAVQRSFRRALSSEGTHFNVARRAFAGA